MDITIQPHKLHGTIAAIPSKSQAHRLLICAAFADRETEIICPLHSQDIDATADCLRALGAHIESTDNGFRVKPITNITPEAELNCRESGSTLRFLLPICGALGVDTRFHTEGRLSQRPLSPLWEEMERMGCRLSISDNIIHCTGKLQCGDYHIRGNVSSQFITGLMFALALIPSKCTLTIEGKLESGPYVEMTKDALSLFGVIGGNPISGQFHSPGSVTVEGDWSNAAFLMAASALGSQIAVTGLSTQSHQGDSAISQILPILKEYVTISCGDIPDLVPIMAVVAAANKGAEFTDIHRLRMKESDRVKSIEVMLRCLGCRSESTGNTLHVFPGKFQSCTISSFNDHRIAMAAAIAATVAEGPITITNAQCVRKSYPEFWQDYRKLGGCYEQFVR